MKTVIKYLDNDTRKPSDCGDPLEIELSSRDLNWEGVLLEKGWSPHFYPVNIITESFYFALAVSSPATWKASSGNKVEQIKADPGEVWLNPPDTPFTHEVNEPCFFIILLFDEAELYKNFREKLPARKLNFLNQYNVNDPSLAGIINLFYEEAKNEGRNGRIYLDSLKKLLSGYFIKNYSDYQDIISDKQRTTLSEPMIESVTKYIQYHVYDDITIDTLAFNIGFSKFYFLKEFKKAAGITPYQFILKHKLEKAEELLLRTDKPIIEIALNLGFTDQSHFTRTFTARYGVSPKRYKSNYLQK